MRRSLDTAYVNDMCDYGWGVDFSRVDNTHPGHEMDVIIKPRDGSAIHSAQELTMMSPAELTQHYELFGINGQHRKAILYDVLSRDETRDANISIDDDPR